MKVLRNIGRRFRQSLHDVAWIFWRELRQTVRDEGVLIFFLLVPLAYPLVYAFIYHDEVVRDVPVAVVDDSRTTRSRDYLRRVDASPDVRVAAYCADMEEARRVLREQGAYGIVRVPSSFASDLARGRQTRVFLYCDMSGLLYYKSLLMAATDVSLEMNADIRIAAARNSNEEQDRTTAAPIAYRDVALFNPTAGFAAFLWDGILIGATATRRMLWAIAVAAAAFFVVYYAFSGATNNHVLWCAFLVYLFLRRHIKSRLYIRSPETAVTHKIHFQIATLALALFILVVYHHLDQQAAFYSLNTAY